MQNRHSDPRREKTGCWNFWRFFKRLKTLGRQCQAPRPARDAGGRAAVDAHGRAVDDPGAAGTAGTGGREGVHGDGGRVYAQRGTAAAIVARGGDYALALKGNQETLREDVAEYLDNPPESAELLSHQEVGKGHGRVERRTATVCHDVEWLQERHEWPGLSAIGTGFSRRGRGAASRRRRAEHRHPLLPAQRQALGRALRARRPLPLGDRERRCVHRTPALGARCRWTKTGRATARATPPPVWGSSAGWP